ncbi:hypothetical protein [Microcoleus sp. AR_TQ3_B6]|uniref:hypothetical protein n=1 Tax=Microcoleus sp. AR_TQ3_B6 TaxID=3055284 RepID=UPI002FD40DE1
MTVDGSLFTVNSQQSTVNITDGVTGNDITPQNPRRLGFGGLSFCRHYLAECLARTWFLRKIRACRRRYLHAEIGFLTPRDRLLPRSNLAITHQFVIKCNKSFDEECK